MNTIKWCVKATEENQKEVETFFRSKRHEYIGYDNNWRITLGSYYYYPQVIEDAWGAGFLSTKPEYKDHILISTEDFYKIAGLDGLERSTVLNLMFMKF